MSEAAAAVRPSLPTRPPRPSRVYVFATCLVDLMAPGAGVDAITLLRDAGIAVELPAGRTCCGQPAYSSGYAEEARRVAQAQLALFPEPWPIVVPSGSCAAMMAQHWPALFAATPALAERARDIAGRVIEWSAFVQQQGLLAASNADAAGAVRVALHTSCHGRRALGTHEPGEALLRALPGVELVAPARVAECCGFGGTFAARHPAISGAMVADKLEAVRDSGAEVLVSADCGCLLNLHHAAERRRQAGEALPRCVHLASFVRERLGAADAARQVTD